MKRTGIWLAAIVAFGLVIRLLWWPDYLTFDYEKARDAIASRKIYQEKNVTLLGPVTEVDGIYHGPLYYYLLGIPYQIFNGDPRAASIISFGFNLAAIVAIYFAGLTIFNKKVGLIAAFLYACSFEAISYAYWLSNPGPSIPFLFLLFTFLYLGLQKNQKWLPLAFLCWGISIQFQVLNVIFGAVILASLVLLRKWKLTCNVIGGSLAALAIPLATFGIFELKNNLLMTKTFISGYLGGNKPFNFNVISVCQNYFSRLAKEVSDVLLPRPELLGNLLLLPLLGFVIYQSIKHTDKNKWRLILIWLLSTIPIFLINSRMSQSSAAFIGVAGAIILTAAYLIEKVKNSYGPLPLVCILTLVMIANIVATQRIITDPGLRRFDFFEGLFLENNLTIIDWTRKQAEGKPFKVDTVTSPLYISPLWDYLYGWQSDISGQGKPILIDTPIHFLIIEPVVDQLYKDLATAKQAKYSSLVSEKYFGMVLVQRWQWNGQTD